MGTMWAETGIEYVRFIKTKHLNLAKEFGYVGKPRSYIRKRLLMNDFFSNQSPSPRVPQHLGVLGFLVH